jgi:hypothetical protein
MAEDNLSGSPEPVVAPTTPPTEDELIGDISNLLDDPATDPIEDEPDEAAADTKTEDDDPLGLDADAEDEAAEVAEEPDDSDDAEIKGGRFAPDSAKVKLEDGTTITIAELKRNNLYHAGFTQKTQALSEEKKAFEAERQKVTEYAQSLDQFREYATWYAEQHLPKEPGPPPNAVTDPAGYLAWSQKRDEYIANVQAFEQFKAQKVADDERKNGETEKQTQERLKRESEALFKAIPVLKDPVKGKQVWSAMVAGAQEHYGISEAELNNITDHRILLGLRDALGYRRIKAAAPKVREEVVKKPAIRDGRRAPSNQAATREKQARSERLRNSGSFDDGVAALSDFDL